MKKILVVILALILCMGTLAACATQKTPLDIAKDYLYSMYKDDAEATPSDYELVAVVNKDGVVYTVEWTVAVTEGDAEGVKVVPAEDGKTVKVDVDEKAAADIVYTLTATIKDAEGNTATVSFNRKVPMFRELTFAEYVAAKAKAPVVVKGVITAVLSKDAGDTVNGIYMQDNDGGYYIYGLADGMNIADYKVGMTIRASGEKDVYNGTHEVKNATIEIIDANVTAVTPVDFTKIYQDAADLKADALVGQQAMLVTIKGVEIVSAGDNGYYNFKLGDKQSYIRISSSTCPLNAADTAKFEEEFGKHIGWIANATGLITVYNGAFYLTPVTVDAFNYLQLPDRTDAEAVEYEKEKLTLSADQITKDNLTIDLPAEGASYDKVAITWAVAGGEGFAKIEGGKLVVTELPAEKAELTLTATLKAGEATATKEFKVNVDKKQTVALVPEKVENPVKDTAYKLALDQTQLGKTLYFAGTVGSANYKLATTDNPDNAVDVYLEETTGGYYFYFYEGTTKKYLNPITFNSTSASLEITTTPTGVFAYDATIGGGVWVATVNEVAMYFGAYGTKDEIQSSATTYITGDNAANVGVSQYPVYLAAMKEAVVVMGPEKVENPVKDTAYKLALDQTQLGKTLYFAGTVGSANYKLATTDNPDNAVDVYLEETTGGYYFYFYEGTTKKYLNPITFNSTSASLEITATPTGVFAYDATIGGGVWVATVNEVAMYFGAYGTKDEIQSSATTYITGDNAANVGVSQYPVYLAVLVPQVGGGNQGGNGDGGNTPTPNPGASDVKTGVAYYITGVNANGGLYFNGTMNNGRVGATATKANAVAVYFEAGATAGQYYIYFMDGTTKTYISYVQNSSSKTASFVYTTTKDDTCLWTVDATAKKILSCVDDTRGFGTDNTSTYENFSTYSTSNTQSKYVWCWIEEVPAA